MATKDLLTLKAGDTFGNERTRMVETGSAQRPPWVPASHSCAREGPALPYLLQDNHLLTGCWLFQLNSEKISYTSVTISHLKKEKADDH